jgi:uncharacterized protein YuzE/DNA-binding XRE family transcriptional regulator
MRYVYDRATDSLAISFADGRRYRDSQEIHDGVVIDYDTAGRPIGIEFSDRASRYVDTDGLADGRWIEIAHPDLRPSTGRMTGAELRARRLEVGMTQEQLAEQLETTKNTIARWERDEVRIEHGGMLRLALEGIADWRPKTSAFDQSRSASVGHKTSKKR